MYGGQIAQITNRADWVSDFYQIVDDDTGAIINIANPDIGFACSVYIKDRDNCCRAAIDLSGGVIVAEADDGPGIQWIFRADKLSCLRPGTYVCGVKITANDVVCDLVIGSVAIFEGL